MRTTTEGPTPIAGSSGHRIIAALAGAALAILGACLLVIGEASRRFHASTRSGEEWSARLDRYGRLGALAGTVRDRARAVLESRSPEQERSRMGASVADFNLAWADAIGELRLATPSLETNSVLWTLHDLDGAMTEVVGQAETGIPAGVAEGGPAGGALVGECSAVTARVRAILDRHATVRQTHADSRRLAERVLAGAAAFLMAVMLFYGGRALRFADLPSRRSVVRAAGAGVPPPCL